MANVFKIEITNVSESQPSHYCLTVTYTNGKKENIKNLPAKETINLFRENNLPFPKNKFAESNFDNKIDSRTNARKGEHEIISITNTTKAKGHNSYYMAKITYKYGNSENVTMSVEDLEKLYNDNFIFIPEELQDEFDNYYAKNKIIDFGDDYRETNFFL